jgi:predicted CXXCH cytochrome family protein
MAVFKGAKWLVAAAIGLISAGAIAQGQAQAAPSAAPVAAVPVPAPAPEPIISAVCLGCHGNEGFSAPGPDGQIRQLHVDKDKFGRSVHGKRECQECHKDITEIPHKNIGQHKVSCVECHEALWDKAQKEGKTQEFAKLGVVVQMINRYMNSIHARPSMADQSRTNATCYNCHEPHSIFPRGTPERNEWRMNLPNICGNCHVKERQDYGTSVHGKEVLEKHNPKAAICSDCHTTHDIENPDLDKTKLVITQNCGNCHAANLKSYLGTYHGQVNTLGYAYTAKCFDCHGNHTIQRVDDPRSSVYKDNRVQTCQKCHTKATAGFATFEPHANTHDFAHYPYMWVASKFMIGLLVGVFAFFWAHSALWFYREYQERKARMARPHVLTNELPHLPAKQYQRFGPLWRVAHLCFALSVMTLVLTGMAVFYGDTSWAKSIMAMFGTPRTAGIVHRVAATIMLSIFFTQLAYFVVRLWRNRKTFNWFGPTSLVPGPQDIKDAAAMFAWFFGRGPRPRFDRWTYWERFDYWAVFWGMGIIGSSGVMLAFPNATASILPGWVFNVATLIHGEEAFLAAVFLFTVHFFNNHLRPDKLPPPDIVMFTGAVPLEEFEREHALEYERLKASGELEKYLVDAPSRPMTIGSRILGLTLIAFGLTLLVLVVIGLVGNMTGS